MMNEKLMKLMMQKKKEGKGMSETEVSAKKSVLGELKKLAQNAMGDKVKGLKKVTVAAPDAKSLKEGLETAEELVSPEESEEGSLEDMAKSGLEEVSEEMSEEDMMSEEMSEAELDAKIAELLKKKEELKKA
jgi:hypothetical protein